MSSDKTSYEANIKSEIRCEPEETNPANYDIEVEIKYEPEQYFLKQESDKDEELSAEVKEEVTVEPDILDWCGQAQNNELSAQYRCEMCNHYFYPESELIQHRKVHEVSNAKNNNLSENKARKTKHNTNSFTCGNCNEKFKSASKLAIHFKKHCDFKTVKCNICKKVFSKMSAVRIHVRDISERDTSVTCVICKKVFNLGRKYRNHVRSHTRKPFPCNLCNKVFTQRVELDSHVRHHKQVTNPFQCNVCQVRFTKKYHLDAHKVIHL